MTIALGPLALAALLQTAAPAVASDVRFDSSIGSRIETKRTKTGHILVHPTIDGKDVGWFVLDTGAGGMVVSKRAAETASLPKTGEVAANGIGGEVTAAQHSVETFVLGPMSLTNLVFTELDLEFLSTILGVPIGGVAGYDVFANAVVEMDVDAGTVDVRDPSAFRLDGGAWQDLVLQNQTPRVRCRFEGDREGLFRLDTGSDSFVVFHSPAVKQLALLDGRETSLHGNGGVGGMNVARRGTLAWFELGGHRFESPTVEFSLAEKGTLADPEATGNLGCAALAPFRIVLDYPHRRVAFVRKVPPVAK
jgi:aspartyl protease